MARSSDHGFEGDAVAEAVELEQCAAATVFGVVAGDDEVVATEIVVAGVGGQDVPGTDGLWATAAWARLPPRRTATRRNRAWA